MIQLFKRWSALIRQTLSPKVILTLLLCSLLGSCASIPLSTMAKLSGFGPENFIQLKADEVQLRVQQPPEIAVDPKSVILELYIATAEHKFDQKFELHMLSSSREQKDPGWFSSPLLLQSYVFELNEPSKQKFRELQQHLASTAKPDQIVFTASYKLATTPATVTTFQQWVDLRLTADEGFLPLIDGAKLTIDPTVSN